MKYTWIMRVNSYEKWEIVSEFFSESEIFFLRRKKDWKNNLK